MKYTKSFAFPLLCALIALTSICHAEWMQVPPSDSQERPFQDQFVVSSAIPTSATLADTLNTVVADFDIASSPTITIATGSVTAPEGPRNLAVLVSDADAGGEIGGTVTLTFTNQFGRKCKEVITFSGTALGAKTNNACVGKPTVEVALTGTEASDLLHIGPYAYGSICRSSSLSNVLFIDSSGGTSALDAGTWTAGFSIYKPAATVAEGDYIQITTFQDVRTPPPGGDYAVTAVAPDTAFP